MKTGPRGPSPPPVPASVRGGYRRALGWRSDGASPGARGTPAARGPRLPPTRGRRRRRARAGGRLRALRTDHEQYTGALAGFAFVPGHETVGVIEAIGGRAAERWGVAVGDRVAVEVFQSCRACPACLAGEYRRCERHGLADMYGFVPVDRAWAVGWLRRAPVPGAGLDGLAGPGCARCAGGDVVRPLGAGIRWGSRSRARARATWSPSRPRVREAERRRRGQGGRRRVRDGHRARSGRRRAPGLQRRRSAPTSSSTSRGGSGAGPRTATAVWPMSWSTSPPRPRRLRPGDRLARPASAVVVAGTGSGGAPGFSPTASCSRSCGCWVRWGSAPSPTGLRWTCWSDRAIRVAPAAHREPRRAEDLVLAMAGEGDGPPPVHGVLTPERRSGGAAPAGRSTHDAVGLEGVGDDVAVGVGGGDLGDPLLGPRTVRACLKRSERLAAPTYWMLMATVEARAPLSKSWFDQARRAGAVDDRTITHRGSRCRRW